MRQLNGLGDATLELLAQADLNGIIITDRELNIRAWNRWMEIHSGYQASQVLGKNLLEVYPSLASRRVDSMYREALAGQVSVLASVFHQYLLPMAPVGTGEFPHMHQSAKILPLRDQHQEIIGTITFIEDVTERVLREAEIRQYISELQETRNRIQKYLEVAGVMFVVLNTAGEVTLVNRKTCEVLGWEEKDLLGRNWFHNFIVEPEIKASVLAFAGLLRRELGKYEHTERTIKTRDGSERLIAWHHTTLTDKWGGVSGTLSSGEDITEQRRLQANLARESAINAAVAELSRRMLHPLNMEDLSDLTWRHAQNLTDSPLGFVGYIDPATGFFVSPSMARDIWDQCRIDDKSVIFQKFRGLWGWVLEQQQPLLTNAPLRDPRSTGVPAGHLPIRRFLAVPSLYEGQLVGQIAVANAPRDYTAADQEVLQRLADLYALAVSRIRLEEELRDLAITDPLTGLFNRRGFITMLEQEIKQARRTGAGFWLLYADLDGMKWINDNLGHQEGDRALISLAQIVRDTFRTPDITGRLGGDEFAVLALQSDANNGEALQQRLTAKLEEFNRSASLSYRLSLSVGMTYLDPKEQVSLEDLLSRADQAMYAQKQSKGKERISLHPES